MGKPMLKTDGVASGLTPVDSFYTRYAKRVFYVMFSVIIIPVLMPIFLVVAVLAKLDGGPVFFIQPRIGRNGTVFPCYKFRTMVVDAEGVLENLRRQNPEIDLEWRVYQKLENDPRISKIGRLLRITSLDELPQIFNVLWGHMSVVGPRPFLPDQKDIYDAAGGKLYYTLRPGITGPWQVFGRNTTKFEDRIGFDDVYSRRISFWGDIRLILSTFSVVLSKSGR